MDKVKENKGGLMVLLALVILTVVFFVTKKPKQDVLVNDDVLSEVDPLVGSESSASVYVPMPADSQWIPKEVSEDKLTLDIPTEYYVSKPRIGDCDVTSISTVTADGKPVSIALVYNVGCDNADLKVNYSQAIEKNGYIFRTNYTSPSVLAVFERLVNSAK